MIGMFCALDIVTFYIFFEAVLIPMFIIIGIWGSENRIYAALKFFLYTLTGSVLMLVAILIMYNIVETTDILALTAYNFSPAMQTWLWLALFASFAVKVPMWPVHTWLPDAHVQAPTAGSVILAGVLLKMGAYGFMRFSIPMFPYASQKFSVLIFALSAVAVIYTSLVAFAQEDIKKLIAYSSIAHMSFVTAGLFTLTSEGMEGALFQMLSHGIVSAALFLCVGILYDRHHTKKIASFGGVVRPMPLFAAFFMLFTMASIGLPGTSGFVGELLVMIGSFKVSTWLAASIATSVILGAIYMLSLYRRVVLGKPAGKAILALPDIKAREMTILIPLAALVLWMGLYPDPFLARMRASVDRVISDYHAGLTHRDMPDQTEAFQPFNPSTAIPTIP